MSVAIVVLGNGALGRDGVYRISSRCVALVEGAGRLAEAVDPALVVFTGWSPAGGLTEAEQMRDAWAGPDVELVVETTARTTAQNAARTLPILLEHGVDRAIVVCTPAHTFRSRFFFGRLFRAHGVETEVRAVRVARSPRALAWELAALTVHRLQLRSASAEVKRTVTRR